LILWVRKEDDNINRVMAERRNTLMCIFPVDNPRINACSIHEWIFNTLNITEEDIRVLQIGGPRRVYIKFTTTDKTMEYLQILQGTHEFRQYTGEVSQVQVSPICLGHRIVRVVSLPPKQKTAISTAMSYYGDVKMVTEDKRSQAYRYKVSNGIRYVHMDLKWHIPSRISVNGQRAYMK
jgi:hypothetical protein